jgi:II/X family phage/plasmid replication protein
MALVYDAFTAICCRLDIAPSVADLEAVRSGAYRISTVDINQAFELPTRSDVLAWIRAAEYKSRTRHGRPQMKGGTIYWGKHSQRWALKAYSKGEEIEVPKHRLPEALLDTPLAKWANNKLRLELRLKSKELEKLGIETAADLTPVRARQLYGEYVGRLDMKEQIALSTEEHLKLPQRLRGTYALWRCGEDLRSTLPKATYFRHRKAFLEYGIDIALRQESLDRSNVVPLIRILQAEPASIPEWAFAQRLVHRSARSPRVAASA